MPEAQDTDSITQEQYDQYTADWLNLLTSGSAEDLQQAFEASGGARLNFSTFSIDQIRSLVTATDVQLIKARFLLMHDATDQLRFSTSLFAVDAENRRLSEYYIPTEAAATTTQTVGALNEPSTQIAPEVALRWLTDWVDASALTAAEFTTPHGPMHGFNFEVSTFQDPLAGAPPYADKCLFLNYGLSTEAESTQITLVVYIDQIGSRTQGSLRGIPSGDIFYDNGEACPPSH